MDIPGFLALMMLCVGVLTGIWGELLGTNTARIAHEPHATLALSPVSLIRFCLVIFACSEYCYQICKVDIVYPSSLMTLVSIRSAYELVRNK